MDQWAEPEPDVDLMPLLPTGPREPAVLTVLRLEALKHINLPESMAAAICLVGELGGLAFYSCLSLRPTATGGDHLVEIVLALTSGLLLLPQAVYWCWLARRAREQIFRFAEGNLVTGFLLWNLLSRESPEAEAEQSGLTRQLLAGPGDDVGISFRHAAAGFPRRYRRWCANYGLMAFPFWTEAVRNAHVLLMALLPVPAVVMPLILRSTEPEGIYAMGAGVATLFVSAFMGWQAWELIESQAVALALLRVLEGADGLVVMDEARVEPAA